MRILLCLGYMVAGIVMLSILVGAIIFPILAWAIHSMFCAIMAIVCVGALIGAISFAENN